MRALLVHANKFQSKIEELSTRPASIVSEDSVRPDRELSNCLVVLFCVEKGDTEQSLQKLYEEIQSMSHETKLKRIMISPFVHLSNTIAEPDVAKLFYEKLVSRFAGTDFEIETSHFGYHKSLLLDLKGYPGAFRYREFL